MTDPQPKARSWWTLASWLLFFAAWIIVAVCFRHPGLSMLNGDLPALWLLAVVVAILGLICGVVGVLQLRLRSWIAWFGLVMNAASILFLIVYPIVLFIIAISQRKTPMFH